jgi:hypothetical protein
MLKIYTIVNTRIDLLELQLRSFSKNLAEEFEFWVINNGANLNTKSFTETVQECNRLKLRRIDVVAKDRYSLMTQACTQGVQWTWQNVISKQTDNILLVHHDMFMIKPAVLTDYIKDVPLAFVPQSRPGVPVHLWEGFVLADIDKLPDCGSIDWGYGDIEGTWTDTGGRSHYWFQEHPDVKYMAIQPVHTHDSSEVDFHPAMFEHLSFNGDPLVLHYRAASDWANLGQEYHRKKTDWLRKELQ